jgi:hypothetical protein
MEPSLQVPFTGGDSAVWGRGGGVQDETVRDGRHLDMSRYLDASVFVLLYQ